jgi:CheY-like chemotaxis protein
MLIWAGTLRRGTLDAAARARGIEVIERNVKVQARLIDDLLDMSRIMTGKVRLDVRPVELRGVIEAALDSVRPAAEAKSITLTSTCGSTPVPVRGDPDRLQQIVWNLLTNAIKFTPREGRIEIRLERVDGDAEITIEDTGVGISPDFLPHIFDRFRQAESGSTRSHGGLGLGLAIVRNLVDLHGGGVHAASPGPGRGATFSVTLPLAGPRQDLPAPQRAAPRQPTPPRAREAGDGMPDLGGLRVLVVDDEVDACEAIAVALELAGANARTARSARDALGVIEAWAPDVLVSDIGLPQEDGYALIRTVRAGAAGPRGGVPALALTAYAHAEDRARALRAGYQAHLAKPVDLRELVAVVSRLCGRASEEPRAEPYAGMSQPPVLEQR